MAEEFDIDNNEELGQEPEAEVFIDLTALMRGGENKVFEIRTAEAAGITFAAVEDITALLQHLADSVLNVEPDETVSARDLYMMVRTIEHMAAQIAGLND